MSSTSGCPFSLGFCNFNEKNSYDKVSLEFKAQEQASPSTCDINALVRWLSELDWPFFSAQLCSEGFSSHRTYEARRQLKSRC